MSLSTIQPNVFTGPAFHAANVVNDEPNTAPVANDHVDGTLVGNTATKQPTIASSARSRLFLKLLPIAGLAWAWLFEGSELAGVGIGTWTGFALLSTLLIAAASDLATTKIPNAITYPAFAWILGLGVVREAIACFGLDPTTELLTPTAARWTALIGGPPLVEQLVGAIACFGIMFFMFIVAKTGGGDVKLSTVIGLALGTWAGIAAIVATYIAAGCYALCWSIVKFGPVRVVVGFGRLIGSFIVPLWVAPPSQDDEKLLFAPLLMGAAFMVGTLFAMYQFSYGRSF